MIEAPLQILCADDDVQVLAMLESTLRAKGFEVETALDGEQALRKINAAPQQFDLIITDSKMPRLDGFGLVKQLQSAGYRGRIVVFASALKPEERRRYHALGVEQLITKPDGSRELIDVIETLHSSR